MHIVFALMLMTCYSGKTCKSVAINTYPTKEQCQLVAKRVREADDAIMATCTEAAISR